MEATIQQIDYNTLLMMHLNRLSYVTTSNFIDVVGKEEQFNENPISLGQKALEWGCHYLFCIVPDDIKDKQFKDDMAEYLKENETTKKDFAKLKAIINLLNRKGLLLSKQMLAKPKKFEQKEEWEE